MNTQELPQAEEEHEHGTVCVTMIENGEIMRVDEICACVAEGMQLQKPLTANQYITVLPVSLNLH